MNFFEHLGIGSLGNGALEYSFIVVLVTIIAVTVSYLATKALLR